MPPSVYQKNLKIEANPEAMALLKVWKMRRYPGSKLITVTDRERQLKGIDFIIATEEGELINIDIKVRDAKTFPKRYWKGDPNKQDILFETKQGDSPYGWANNPDSQTDIVVHIFTGLTDEHVAAGFQKVVTVPHHVCNLLTTGYRQVAMANKYRVTQAHNGYATTYCIAIPVNQVIPEAKRFLDID
jgi:hypothetical protein